MALSKIEAKEWLTELGFSAEKVESLSKEFTGPQLQKIAEGYARQSDYDSAMNAGKAEVATKQQQLDEANQRLNAELAEWATVQAEGGKVTAQMRKDLDAAQQDALKAKQVLTRIATEAGLNPQQVLAEVGTTMPTPTATPTAAAPDLTGYVRSDDLSKSMTNVAELAITVPAELQQIAAEHQDLYGQRLDTRTIVAELRNRANTRGNQRSLDVRTIWEEMHKVPDARRAADEKRYNDAITAAEARGREAGRSEISIPGNVNTPGKHSIVFGGQRQSSLQRPQPGQTVATAAASLRSGKYRSGGGGTTTA